MREWTRTNVTNADKPEVLRGILQNVDTQMRELTLAVKLLGGGRVPVADNVPLPVSGGGTMYHNQLLGLSADDHSQYLLLAGRTGGQTVSGLSSSDNVLNVNASVASPSGSILRLLANSTAHWTFGIGGVGYPVMVQGPAASTLSLVGGATQNRIYCGGTNSPSLILAKNSGLAAPFIELGAISNTITFGGKIDSYTSSPALFALDAANQSSSVANTDDNLRIVQRSAIQTGYSIRVLDNTRATTKFGVTAAGKAIMASLGINGATSGTITLDAAATTTNHTLTLPSNNASGVLTNNGSGALSWSAGATHTLLDGNIHSDTVYPGALSRGMMTWVDSSGFWGGFALGAANKVLTSDGTDPGWRTLNKAHLDDRTRTIWLDPSRWSTTATTHTGAAPNSMTQKTMSGTAATTLATTLVLPADYVGIVSCDLYYSNQGTSTNNTVWNFYSRAVATTDSVSAAYDGSAQAVITPPSTANALDIYTGIASTFMTNAGTDYSAGQLIRITLQRDATDGSDTNTTSMSFNGLLINYTADM